MRYTLFIYLKKYWFIAHRGTNIQCEKLLKKCGAEYFSIAPDKSANLPEIKPEREPIRSELRHINYRDDSNKKLYNRFWVEIRAYSSYYFVGEVYNQLVDNKFVKTAKLISRSDKYLGSITEAESIMSTGLDKESMIAYIKTIYPKVNFEDKRTDDKYLNAWKVSVLVFEETQSDKKIVQGELKLF